MRASLAALLLLSITVLDGPVRAAASDRAPATWSESAPEGLRIGGVLHSHDPDWRRGDYAQVAATEFSAVTASIYMPWGGMAPVDSNDVRAGRLAPVDVSGFVEIVDWAKVGTRDLDVHGHTLVWPAANATQSWYADPALDGHRRTVLRHWVTSVAAASDEVAIWDVVNEVIADEPDGEHADRWGVATDTLEYRDLGPGWVDEVFAWAAESADDDVELIINDYGIAEINEKSDHLFAYVQELRRRGVPVDGVGMQMHLRAWSPLDLTSVRANVERFLDAGFSVHVTELDVMATESSNPAIGPSEQQLAAQAERFREIVELAVTTPGFDTVLLWDFADDRSWLHPIQQWAPGLDTGTYTFPAPWSGGAVGYELEPKPAYWAIGAALDAASAGDLVSPPPLATLGVTLQPASNDGALTESVDGSVTVGAVGDATWTLESTGDGYWRIRHDASGRYLSRRGLWDGTSWQPGTDVMLDWLDTEWWSQQWSIRHVGDAGWVLTNRWGQATGVLHADELTFGVDDRDPDAAWKVVGGLTTGIGGVWGAGSTD